MERDFNEFESVSEDVVIWTAENVKKRLANLQSNLRDGMAYVDEERKKDEKDTSISLLVFLGTCLLYPVMPFVFHSVADAFRVILLPLFLVGISVIVFLTGRNFINALTTFCVRDCENPNGRIIEKSGIATYVYEKIFYEEQFLRISKYIREVDELVRWAQKQGELADKDFERLTMLQYVQTERMGRDKKTITFREWLTALIRK